MLRSWPLLAALTLLPGCQCGQDEPETSTAAGTPTPAVTPEIPRDLAVLDAVESLGTQGAFVVVVRPEHWAALHTALSSWLARLPSEAEPLRKAKTAEDLPGLFAYPLGIAPERLDIQGWDPNRPIVASIGETPYHDGLPGTVTASMPTLELRVPPVRHQVLVPATDPGALVQSLATLLGPMGTAWPALVEGHAGAQAIDHPQVRVALIPQDAAVRVVIFQGGLGLDEAKRLAYHRENLSAIPGALHSTAALSLLGQPDAVASALVRPWRMRPLAAVLGRTEMLYALATVSADVREQLLARGTQIVLAGELLMTDEGAEADDMALSLSVDEGVLRMRSVMSLTPKGAQVLEAAADTAGSVPATADSNQAWVDLTVRADARALLDAATMPPVFTRGKTTKDGVEAVQEGGIFATFYMGMRYPLGILRTAEELAKQERIPLPLRPLPVAAHLTWHGLPPDGPTIAMAVQWPEGYDPSPLGALVPMIQSAQHEFRSFRMDTAEHDGKPLTTFGLGGLSSDAFELKREQPGRALMEGRLSLSRLGAELVRHEPEVGALLVGVGDVVFTTEHRGRALITEVAWSPSPSPVETKTVSVSTNASWDSPIGSDGDSPGARCLADAGWGLAAGLDAIGMISDSLLGTAATKILAETEAALECASKDDATKDAAQQLRAMATRLLVETLVAAHDGEAALTLLEQQCSRSKHVELCAEHKALAARPRPTLATVELSEACTPTSPSYGPSGEADIRLDAKGISIDGVTVASSELASTLATAFTTTTTTTGGSLPEPEFDPLDVPKEDTSAVVTSAPKGRTVTLAVDGELSMSRVRPLLRTLIDQGVRTVALVLRDDKGDPRVLFVPLQKASAIAIPAAPEPTATPEPADPSPTGIVGTTKGAAPPRSDWATIEISAAKAVTRTHSEPEPREHAAPGAFPSASTLRGALSDATQVFVYGDDSATWKEVALALAATCEHAALVLDDPHP